MSDLSDCNSYIYKTRKYIRTEKKYEYTWFDLNEWVKKYNPQKNVNFYNDPDQVCNYGVKNTEYYDRLTDFLCEKVKKQKWNCKITPPQMGKSVSIPEDRTIQCCFGNGKIFYLHSDQFGFSEKGNNCRNPYFSVVNKYVDKDQAYCFVAKCLYNTRKIGGSFLWPKAKVGRNWQSMYNLRRGQDPVQDRVDMTLLEIKNYLDNKKEYKFENDLLYAEIKGENRNMKEWLDLFSNFDDYVEFFEFTDFCIPSSPDQKPKNYHPIDITKKEKEKLISDSSGIENMEINELTIMLNNLCVLIDERSKKIMNVIKK